jgi:hypothetical protein
MMLPASPPRPDARAQLLPGLSLRVGDVLGGRYRLESLVSAEHALVQFAAEVAAKHVKVDVLVLFGNDALNDGVRLRFLAEARKTAALVSPHAARVLHVGVTADGHPFLVRERLPARTLGEVLDGGHCLATEQAVDLVLDVCDALLEAHAADVMHGELATHAVHLDWDGKEASGVKLAGLATERVLASLPLDTSRIGMPVMRAPELLADRKAAATVGSDVWGVGVLLYTMLAGAPPFMAETPSAVSVSVTSEEQASLAGVPDPLADLVDACLSKDPARRPRTMREVADRLLPFASRPEESLARLVARARRPSGAIRTSLAPSPSLAVPPAATPTERAIPAAKARAVDVDMPTPLAPRVEPVDLASVGIETGKYKALELERLRTQVAAPPDSELNISMDVEVAGSVRDVGAVVVEAKPLLPPVKAPPRKREPEPAAREDEDERKANTGSAPPVAMTIPPPATASAVHVAKMAEPKLASARMADAMSEAKMAARPVSVTLAPAPHRTLRIGGAMTAAACLAAGIVLGILVPRARSKDAAAHVAETAIENVVSAPTPLLTATLDKSVDPTEVRAAAAEPKPAEMSLALMSAVSPMSSTIAAKSEPAKTEPANAEPANAAKAASAKAAAKPSVAPIRPAAPAAPVRPASATHQPETKAHDDDLRRFLDDRR